MFHFTRTSKREHALYVHFTRIGNIEHARFDIQILNNTVYRQSKDFTTCIQHNPTQLKITLKVQIPAGSSLMASFELTFRVGDLGTSAAQRGHPLYGET